MDDQTADDKAHGARLAKLAFFDLAKYRKKTFLLI